MFLRYIAPSEQYFPFFELALKWFTAFIKYNNFHFQYSLLQIYGADGSLLRAESRRGRGKGRGGAVSITLLQNPIESNSIA